MKLSDFVEINPRTSLPKGTVAEFVPMEAINPARRYVKTYPKKKYAGGTKFINGDTLFARITPCLENGKISQFVSDSDIPAFGSTEYWVLRAKDKVSDPSFVYYLAKSELLRKPAEKSMVGASGRQRAQIESIQDLDVGDMTLEDQQKTASVLSAYDDLIENNSRRIKKLEKMARMLYRNEASGIEATTTLGSKVTIKKGKNITKATIRPGDVPVVAGGLQPAYYHDTANTIGPVITISASGANAGFTNIYYQNVWASDCSYIDASSTQHTYFFYTLLQNNQYAITHMQKGSAQPHVYPEDLKRLEIPDFSDAKIELISGQMHPIYDLIGKIKAKNNKLAHSRDLLLPRLMTGALEL